jgi:hypothetical protein
MPLYDLELYLFRLKHEPALQTELRMNAEQHLAAQELDTDARTALYRKDLAALWSMGVHPLLLAPLGRMFGLAPEEYRQALRPVAHLREFRS